MFSRAVAILSRTLSGDGKVALAFALSNPRGDGILGRYLNPPVHLVRHQGPFHDPTCFLPGQRMQEGPKCLTQVSKHGFTTPFGHADPMRLAMPSGMGQALRGC
jgi:hypothetical protein